MLPCTRIHVQCINFIVSNFDSIALQHCTSSLDVDQTHGHSDTHSLSHNVSFDHHDMKYNGTRFTIKSVVLIEYSFQTSSNSPLIDKSMRCVVHSIIFFLINNVQFHCSLMQREWYIFRSHDALLWISFGMSNVGELNAPRGTSTSCREEWIGTHITIAIIIIIIINEALWFMIVLVIIIIVWIRLECSIWASTPTQAQCGTRSLHVMNVLFYQSIYSSSDAWASTMYIESGTVDSFI